MSNGNINVEAMKIYHKKLSVIGNNIANAKNPDYRRQEVEIVERGSLRIGKIQYGQGIEMLETTRVHDPLLDAQVRAVTSESAGKSLESQWLSKIEDIYNTQDEHGISQQLSQFWNSWQNLSAAQPASDMTARQEVLNTAKQLVATIRKSSVELSRTTDDLNTSIRLYRDEINSLAKDLAAINQQIFENELGGRNQAHDLRDRRDGLLDKLSKKVEISTREAEGGRFEVFVGQHPLIIHNYSEDIVARNNPADPANPLMYWHSGDVFVPSDHGELHSLLRMRNSYFEENRTMLDQFANDLINTVNQLYANGCEKQGNTILTSRLGYTAFGVSDTTSALNLPAPNQNGHIEIGFYDDSNNVVRTAGIVVEASDSLSTIANKLNAIPGLQAATIASLNKSQDGQLQISILAGSGSNLLGEKTIGITSSASVYDPSTGNYTAPLDRDTSGVLSLFKFDVNQKSTNLTTAPPLLQSVDITTLYTEIRDTMNPAPVVPPTSVAEVQAAALGKSGFFTIDCFETATELPAGTNTNGQHVQQLRIPVAPGDSIADIANKVNALTTTYGVSMNFNAVTNCYEITSSAKTDASGNFVSLSPSGTNYLRLSFGYVYNQSTTATDQPPAGYNGLGDNTGLFAKLQLNTLFSGSCAQDIDLDHRITLPNQVHAGYSLNQGNNALALAMFNLKDQKNLLNNTSSLEMSFDNIIGKVAGDAKRINIESDGAKVKLDTFRETRQNMSGVIIDEELAEMMALQRIYEVNARMVAMENQFYDIALHIDR